MQVPLLVKFTATIGSIVLIVMATFMVANLKLQQEFALENSVREVDYLAETILKATHQQMLKKDRPTLYTMMEQIGTQEGIKRIRLFNKHGVINFSTDKSEIGEKVPENAEGCNVCHSGGNKTPRTHAPKAARSRTFTGANGTKYLGVTKGIYNEPSCYTASCHAHPQDHEVIGILDIQVSLANKEAQAAVFRNTSIAITILMLMTVFVSLVVLTKRFIIWPMNQLLSHFRNLQEGHLESRVDVIKHDETGQLAAAANDMACELQRSQNQIKEWANTLEHKVDERTEQIKEMQANLARSEKLASLGKLVAGIAHEINNPLTGILMYASMARENPDLDEETQKDLDTITNETQRCATIVKGLLDFGRESIPKKQQDSINRILDVTLALVEHQATFHDILVNREYEDGLPDIEVDPNQLEQVFMNIILNAAQAMEGSGVLTLRTLLDEHMNAEIVEICDTGGGIPQEMQERIFDPFFSTKEEHGTGLGLSVSYGLVQNHGGYIRFKSTEGGTCFYIYLPVEGALQDSGDKNASV